MSATSSAAVRAPVLKSPYKIVAIGGGTGLSTLLKGIKKFAAIPGRVNLKSRPLVEITAVVTVTDDGGSSGRLRREFDILPPGDIRNCLVALSEDEAMLSRLFQYRFDNGRGLKGHSFGNLFLAALSNLTGDFAHAVKFSSEVLASYGRIYPSTAANVVLKAKLEGGETVFGESNISKSKARIERVFLKPARCEPLEETVAAIAAADLITMGPGSLFTSVIPNLLVRGIPEAIRGSPAVKAYFVNLMGQPGETNDFTASEHVAAIHRHAGGRLLDFAVVNTQAVRSPLRRRYAAQRAYPVLVDRERLAELGVRVLERELVGQSEAVRHDPDAAALVALQLASAGRRRRNKLASGALLPAAVPAR
jgi:uncharacterized cofD-like protein